MFIFSVEALERKRTAFDNPASESWEYRVRDFGYCSNCGFIVLFHTVSYLLYGYLEYEHVICLNCGHCNCRIPEEFMRQGILKMVNQIKAKDVQKILFAEIVESEIERYESEARKQDKKGNKTETRQAWALVHRLEKLRFDS